MKNSWPRKKKEREEVEEKLFELWRLFGEEQKSKKSAEEKAAELWKKVQKMRKSQVSKKNWEEKWANAEGPLKDIPLPIGKDEGGRV